MNNHLNLFIFKNLIDENGNKTIIRHIEEIIRHPNHSTTYKRNDIALIRVNESIPFSNYIMPACLQTELRDENPNVAMILTGWGSSSLKRKRQIFRNFNCT